MDMVQGHYLGTRRASQEQRYVSAMSIILWANSRRSVFKYADKGYGIRILPHYLAALKTMDVANIPKYYDIDTRKEGILDLQSHIDAARKYFESVFRVYMEWTDSGATINSHYVSGGWPGSTKYDRKSEAETGKRKALPVLSHALLDTDEQNSIEPLRRSCLTGFELFYRHVALWEAQEQGRLTIRPDVWASTTVRVYLWSLHNDAHSE